MKNKKWFVNLIRTATIFFIVLVFSTQVNAKVLTKGDIEMQAKDYLVQELTGDTQDMEISIEYRGRDVLLPKGESEFKFDLPGSRDRVGRVSLSLLINVDGVLKKRLWIHADVKKKYRVAKAMRPVRANQILTADDVEVVEILSSQLIRDAVNDLSDVVGFKTQQNLSQNDTIRLAMLKRPPLVKRGDRVMILAEKGLLRVRVPGVVQGNGFKGSSVPVQNSHSNKTVWGMVMDSKTIRVEF